MNKPSTAKAGHPKICAHCVHFQQGGAMISMISLHPSSRCARNLITTPDIIDGTVPHLAIDRCETERAAANLWERLFGHNRCGPEARFFAPKGAPKAKARADD
jgi:hypothetical protein